MSYDDVPAQCFWGKCQRDADFLLDRLYAPQIALTPQTRIATAGSCFAQKIGGALKATNATLLDLEPLPLGMRPATGQRYGYGLYSARYGNIYTSAQLLQLAEDAFAARLRDEAIWQADGAWIDGLRPRIEPLGFASRAILEEARLSHLRKVREIFCTADLLIFTLGLTERWQHRQTGTVFPIWPGALSPPHRDPAHVFENARVMTVVDELDRFLRLVRGPNPGLQVLFTVSPVPLIATATGGHVLAATQRSKAVLRAAVDEILHLHPGCDYFPSYEIVTANPRARSAFLGDEREVRPEIVARIMDLFLAAHPTLQRQTPDAAAEALDPVCEEVLLQAART
ncbi:GSCFA domain-containing protein [Xinfangfangia pollutisoli]|uniref:GSCFA domain-containing protein n=1 Tax=Xinfangfangia pollutisoli TaxID=2865960 RepID=UPI001CD2DF63|nr:GSCFA domain-containing protein [Xinfangfangia pollutisoli]